MTQPNDPPNDHNRPPEPGAAGEPGTPPTPDAPRAEQPSAGGPPPGGSTAYGPPQSRPSDQPAFGPQYAYQYGQQYGGAAPPPMWPQEGPPQQRNGMGIAALVLGIVAVVLSFVPFIHFLGMLLAIVAIILGIVGLRRVSSRAMPIIGIVLSIVALVIGGFWTWGTIIFVQSTRDCTDDLPGASDAEIEECIRDRLEDRFGRNISTP